LVPDVSHERFMDRALELARRGLDEGEQPIAALVTLDGEVVAESFWRGDQEPGVLRHPELVAQLETDRVVGARRGEAVLYTTLEPCLMCMGAAASMFVGRVVYALDSPLDGAARVFAEWAPAAGHPFDRPASYRVPEIVGGVGATEARALLEEYVAQEPRTPAAEWARLLLASLD
jgi:tRNA(adenine34) deaminase